MRRSQRCSRSCAPRVGRPLIGGREARARSAMRCCTGPTKARKLVMHMIERFALILAASIVAASPAIAAFSPEQAPGRLPKNVVPVSYSIAIAPNIAALSLAGRESIVLEVRAATSTIQFNSLNEKLHDVRFDGAPVKRVLTNDQAQGLFAQTYLDPSGAKRKLLSTQMEATDARRMFPCWDEPAFRATFRLTVTVPEAWATVGNMPIARREVHGGVATVSFKRSPKMPSYLVVFSAGDMREVSATQDGTHFGVWAMAGHEAESTVPLANAQQILADYNQYFAYPYPLPKLDSIAVPGGFSGAMENWGGITYNDQALLVGPTSTMQDKQTVFSIQAHEMAHQWFGDLVTMGSWDDTWLNESFASWRAAKETAARNPAWHWWEQEDSSKERAMTADARATSHAIEVHVTDELQAIASFDSDITYNKGQALLRMLESYLGEEPFQHGIGSYIKTRAYSNATAADLWLA